MENKMEPPCPKINGVPILPPLIMEDRHAEINYYTLLAVAVENRLKMLKEVIEEVPKQQSEYDDKNERTTEDVVSLNSSEAEIESITQDITIIDYPAREEKELTDNDTTISDSTDLNQYLDVSTSLKTDTADTTPENWKPQVPKSLDIVPITVECSKSIPEASKLVRQGSYILDAPSPMLLAHMQIEGTIGDYVPTPTANNGKRKEWNISQAKTKWENQVKNKEIAVYDDPKERPRRNSTNNVYKISKSVSHSKPGSPSGTKAAKSADCIQTMLAREYLSKSVDDTQKRLSPYSVKSRFNKSSVLKSGNNRLSGSLGNLNKNGSRNNKQIVERNGGDQCSLEKNSESPKEIESSDLSIQSPKPVKSAATEKITTIFKEIQETHKKQMVELMARQQKEQMMMQENFRKQQVLLLTQIRKAFPDISLSSLTEAVCANSEKSTPSAKQTPSPKVNGYYQRGDQCLRKSPLDIISPLKDFPIPYHRGNSQISQTSEDEPLILSECIQSPVVQKIDELPVGNALRRQSSVSRQLFPLDSKTTLVPVLENTMYADAHIKAANTINAYARGFLVRRMMRTEKLIALRNTYREALHCMLRLHADGPLNLPEVNFHQRLQLQCDAASMNIVDLFSQTPTRKMEIIAHDREMKKSRAERPNSARSYSFATQRTLARKKLKEMGEPMRNSFMSKSYPTPTTTRSRCQTWGSISKEKRSITAMCQGIKRSTSAGAVRKPWR